MSKQIEAKFALAEELKIDDMIYTLCKGNISKRKYVMKNYSLTDAVSWLSFKSRNSAIEKWYMEKDSNTKQDTIKFSSAEEALKFMGESKNA